MPGPRPAWLRALPVAALLLPAAAGAARPATGEGPRLAVPVLDSTGTVRWVARTDSVPGWVTKLGPAPATAADSERFWSAAVRARAALHPEALTRLARLRLAARDTVGADSCWAAILADGCLCVSLEDPWKWPALKGRATIVLARGDTARVDSILERGQGTWTAAEDAERLAWRVDLRLALRDTAGALDLARHMRSTHPIVPASARVEGRVLAIIEVRPSALDETDRLSAWDRYMATGHADLALGVAITARTHSSFPRQWPVMEAQALRALHRTREAVQVLRDSRDLTYKGMVERARLFWDLGQPDSALAWYSASDREMPSQSDVCWEAAQLAERFGRREEARTWLGRIVGIGRARRDEAELRRGLLLYADGMVDSACAKWRRVDTDGARFWWGVARRAAGDTVAGDSALRIVARRVGYDFYPAAARDTLRLRGWPGTLATVSLELPPDTVWLSTWGEPKRRFVGWYPCPDLGMARELLAVGAGDAAAVVLSRLAAASTGRVTVYDPDYCDYGLESLEGSWLAYSNGHPRIGLALADRCVRMTGDLETQWSRVPWLYPPAYESLFVAPRDSVVATLEPALLWAVARQESRFDPRARSRSDALGLMQLKMPAAGDMAKLVGDPAPSEERLFDPQRNVRYGARYLAYLLRRCDGSVAAALSAYNAGAGSLTPRWRELRARGGEALVCELASNPLAQEYAKRILGFRQAYRELRPTTGR